MKAAQINEYGDPAVVQIKDIPKPTAATGQVLVEVHASSLNPFDSSVRAGRVKSMIPQLPITLGGDIAGVVAEVGEGAAGFKPGDRVYGQAAAVAGNSGALAEFAATAATQIGLMPSDLSFESAAALPLVGVSALQALTEHLKLTPGQKLFIHGGAGGIGGIAIQIANHLGAYVATTASARDLNYVKQLGADEAIDYQSTDFATHLQDYDAVFDTVGGGDFTKALTILRSGGIAVSMIARADDAKSQELGVTAFTQSTHVNTNQLEALRELVESGVVKPQVAQTFALVDIVKAFEAREAGGLRGKVVIKIK